MSILPLPSKGTSEKLYMSLIPHPPLAYGILVTLLIICFMYYILQKPEVTTNQMVLICSSLLSIDIIGVVALRTFENQDSKSANNTKKRIDAIKNSHDIPTGGGDSQ